MIVRRTLRRRKNLDTMALFAGALGWLLSAAGGAVHADEAKPITATTVVCESSAGQRQHCDANTSSGVSLIRATGSATCLLGRNWGYDDQGVWVSDGCGGEFVVGAPPAAAPAAAPPAVASPPPAPVPAPAPEAAPAPPAEKVGTKPGPEYIPNLGFKLYEGDKGLIQMRLFSYARYLNQKGLDETYTDAFGNTKTVQRREDIQLTKFFLPFAGWFLSPKFRYYLYVWSSNTSQGDAAQVVGAGNLSVVFNKYATLGVGITSLPGVRSTEGQFPYWLGVDDRLISDEFFRPSYTTGIWLKGDLPARMKYQVMLGNNLSTLGVSASQLDNKLNTTSYMLQWLPTTGEFGYIGTFGDYDNHQQLATRLGSHYTHSTENKQAQPGTNTIENSQIRLTDGSVIFTPELFGPGITVENVDYDMVSIDGGLKYHGFSLELEGYWRKLSRFQGSNTQGIREIHDNGYQVQLSAMAIQNVLQVYAGGSSIRGRFGNGSEIRAGLNWHPFDQRGMRVNAEWIGLHKCPVGYVAVPYPVGGNGDIFSATLELNF